MDWVAHNDDGTAKERLAAHRKALRSRARRRSSVWLAPAGGAAAGGVSTPRRVSVAGAASGRRSVAAASLGPASGAASGRHRQPPASLPSSHEWPLPEASPGPKEPFRRLPTPLRAKSGPVRLPYARSLSYEAERLAQHSAGGRDEEDAKQGEKIRKVFEGTLEDAAGKRTQRWAAVGFIYVTWVVLTWFTFV